MRNKIKERISDYKEYGFLNVIQHRHPDLPIYISIISLVISIIITAITLTIRLTK